MAKDDRYDDEIEKGLREMSKQARKFSKNGPKEHEDIAHQIIDSDLDELSRRGSLGKKSR